VFELVSPELVTNQHGLFVGPPGTGQSAAVNLAAERISGRYVEAIIGPFTETGRGIRRARSCGVEGGEVRAGTPNMLPEAKLACLDEIVPGSSAILNTLLGILNERT
jgi:MoxR-like ATPase